MKTLFYLPILLALNYTTTIYSQDELYDEQKDSLVIEELLLKLRGYKKLHIDTTELYARNALLLSQKHDFIHLELKSRRILGIVLGEKGGVEDLRQSQFQFEKVLSLSRKMGDSMGLPAYYNNMCIVNTKLKEYSKALEFALKLVDLCEKRQFEDRRMGMAYLTLGNIYKRLEVNDSSLVNYTKAKSYFKKSGASAIENVVTSNIGEVLIDEGNYDEAFTNLKYAFDNFKENKDQLNYIKTSNSLGRLLNKIGNHKGAITYYTEGLKTSETSNKKYVQVTALKGLARTYFYQKKYDLSGDYLEKGLHLADSLGQLEEQIELLDLKAKYSDSIGNKDEVLKSLSLAAVLKDSLISLKNNPKTIKVFADHQQRTSKKEVDSLLVKIAKQKKWIILFTLSILLLVGLIYFIVERYRSRLINEKVNTSELEASLVSEKENNAYINRKLVSATANLAIKTDLLSQINKLLSDIKNHSSNDLNKEINETQNQIKIQKNIDNIWKEFFAHFEEVHPEFLTNLKSKYEITQNDLKICAFLKMNLTNKDICQLLNIHPTTVRVNIHRIKKKLNVPKDLTLPEFFAI